MLLMLFIQYGIIASSLPKVGYIKGSDVWLMGCLILIMVPMIESTIVGNLYRRANKIDKTFKLFGRKGISVQKFGDDLDAVCRYSLIIIIAVVLVGYFLINVTLY